MKASLAVLVAGLTLLLPATLGEATPLVVEINVSPDDICVQVVSHVCVPPIFCPPDQWNAVVTCLWKCNPIGGWPCLFFSQDGYYFRSEIGETG